MVDPVTEVGGVDVGRESIPLCCKATVDVVARTQRAGICPVCRTTYAVSAEPLVTEASRPAAAPAVVSDCDEEPHHRTTLPGPAPRARRPASPEQAIENLVRWLPTLSPRSLPLVRAGGIVATSATALDGRPDSVDERSRQVAAAVQAWVRLRRMIARGEGLHVATLWAAYAGVLVLHDAEGRRIGGMAQRARVVAAVALGCASSIQRHDWRERAKEKPRRVAYTSELHPRLYSQGVWKDADGNPLPPRPFTTAGVQDRVRRIAHVEQVGAEGPTMEAQAVAWGSERLADLWAPAPVPPDCARGYALGFAAGEQRSRWEGIRSPALRDAEVAAAGAALLGVAEDAWRVA